MNEKKILLISLSKGKMGDENSSFFGSMFITKLKQAGMARAAMPEAERRDFYLYVDEFQNLVTTTFESLFSESRKYGLALVVANQYMAQLLPSVRATVLGNVGTIVIFRVGGDDAIHLEAEMTPIVKAKDMVNLGMQEFYIKMTIDGNTSDPFSAETLRVLPTGHESYREKILDYTHTHYALSQEEAKRRIAEEETELLGLAKPAEADRALGDSPSAVASHPEPLL